MVIAVPRGQGGFSIVELLIWMGVAISVLSAATTSYIGVTRSWDGTAALSRIQADGSLAVEMIASGVRGGSSVTVGGGGNSLSVFFWTGATDSLIATYSFDGQGSIEDMTGFEVMSNVDSVRFSTIGTEVLNVDLYLRDDRGTPNHAGDDLPVVVSSTVVCRN
jgi:hypothetical protein